MEGEQEFWNVVFFLGLIKLHHAVFVFQSLNSLFCLFQIGW